MIEKGERDSQTAGKNPATIRRVWFLAMLTAVLTSTLIRLRGPADVDTWLHLRIGDAIRHGVRFGVVPDPLVVIADRPYIATQWLSQVIFSFVYENVGLNGILVLRLAALLVLLGAVSSPVGLMPDQSPRQSRPAWVWSQVRLLGPSDRKSSG